MSGNRRKNTVPKPSAPPSAAGEEAAARLVAIPKPAPAAAPEPLAKSTAKPKPERIGEVLRQARIDRGDDLYLIAEYLCIKPVFLMALENSQYDELPPDAYVIGFLRTYANFLGIDGKDAVDRYRYEMAGRRNKPVLAMPVPISEGRAPSGIIIAAAAVVALLIYALWYGISSANRAQVTTPPPLPTVAQTTPAADANAAAGLTAPVASEPSAASSTSIPPPVGIAVSSNAPPAIASLAAAPETANAPNNAPAPTAADAKKQQIYGDPEQTSRIIIRATQSSWVMVTDDNGKAIFDRVLKPGDIYKVPNKPGLSLTTGNGNGITLTLDGVELPKVATGAPHVVRNITLDPDRLKTAPSDSDQ